MISMLTPAYQFAFTDLNMPHSRVSNLKYESVRIDFKAVVLISANPGKGASPNYFFQNNVHLTFRGEGG